MIELRAIVRGRVQLVMFRDFTRRTARKLGITGSVFNCPDGAVEIVAQGERGALETLLKKLHQGSLLSRVDSVESEWHEPVKRFGDFNIIY
ncbi:MAG: acylphosphatase [Patescibacteria group bacterium]